MVMNVRNCKKCGRVFNYVMGPVICPRCKENQEAKFNEVKEYVRDLREAMLSRISWS